MTKTPGRVRIAAVADLHFGRAGTGPPLRTLFADVVEQADVLALCGDLTDTGEPEDARALARALVSRDHPHGRRARQPRLRVRQGAGGDPDPLRCGRARARRHQLRGARRRVRGGQGIRRRVRAARAGAVGRGGRQAVRAGSAERGAQARDRARASPERASDRAACTTRRSRPPSRASRRRSIPTWARAGWRSRSRAIPSTRSSTAMPTTGPRRDARARACRCTTCRCTSCSASSPTGRCSDSSTCPSTAAPPD